MYKEITDKGDRKYKKVWEGALTNQKMGPWGQLTAQLCLQKLIPSAPRNNQKIK